MGPQYLLIVQVTSPEFKSYIAFGYKLIVSQQSKVNGVWNPLKTLS
jgi:hypothetical protein